MLELAIVGIGGAIGAMLRYVLSLRIAGLMGTEFPWGTVTVNVLGSFLIGLLAVALEVKTSSPHYVRLGLMVGVLGGFTTFSAFSADTLHLLESQQWFKAMVYISASVLLCIVAAAAGMTAARQIS